MYNTNFFQQVRKNKYQFSLQYENWKYLGKASLALDQRSKISLISLLIKMCFLIYLASMDMIFVYLVNIILPNLTALQEYEQTHSTMLIGQSRLLKIWIGDADMATLTQFADLQVIYHAISDAFRANGISFGLMLNVLV